MNRPPDHVLATQASSALALLQAVLADVGSGATADAFLQRLYQRHREYGSRDRRFYSNLVFSWFRWKGWLDLAPDAPLARKAATAYRLDWPGSHPALDRMDPPTDPAPAADDRAGWVARQLGLASAPLPEQVLPAAILPRLADPGDSLRPRLLDSFQQRPPTWVRVRAKERASVLAKAAEAGVTPVPHPRLPGALQIPDTARLADLLAKAGAAMEIQDIASQAVGQVAHPLPGQAWWDACAGSGGKSLHLADLAGGDLRILATDLREPVLEEARRRLHRAGLSHAVLLRTWDALQEPMPGDLFDGVLADVPCSGTGTWARHPDARWRWKAEAMDGLVRLQRTILDKAASRVKAGGALVYSTCALTVEENTEAVDAFLAGHPDFQPDAFENPLTGAPCPEGRTYLWPWEGPGSGFFVARFKRD